MWDFLVLGIFFGAIFWIIAFVLGYQLLRHLKGKIKIYVPKHGVSYGENIKFDIELQAKKHLDIENIELELKSYRKERYYNDGRTQTRQVELYKEMYTIWENQTLLAGSKKIISAEIMIPSYAALPKEMQHMIQKTASPKNFQRFYRNKRFLNGDVKWQVKVIAHCKGIDLYSRESLTLNTPNFSGNI